MNKRAVGADYEHKAGEYLLGCGLQILRYNFRCRLGEIDIVARDGEYLVFCEVKYRKSDKTGTAIEAVGPAKAKKIMKVSDYYRAMFKVPFNQPIRYDVVAIDGDHINWIPGAFMYDR